MFTFLDGVFRLWVPIVVIILDYRVPSFGRKPLYMLSLGMHYTIKYAERNRTGAVRYRLVGVSVRMILNAKLS